MLDGISSAGSVGSMDGISSAGRISGVGSVGGVDGVSSVGSVDGIIRVGSVGSIGGQVPDERLHRPHVAVLDLVVAHRALLAPGRIGADSLRCLSTTRICA